MTRSGSAMSCVSQLNLGHLDLNDSFSSYASSVSTPYSSKPTSADRPFGSETPSPPRRSSVNFDQRVSSLDIRMVVARPTYSPDYMGDMDLQHSSQDYYRDHYNPIAPPRTGNPMEMGIPPLSFMDQIPVSVSGTHGAYTYLADGLPQSSSYMAPAQGYPAFGTSSPGAPPPMWIHDNAPMPMFESSPSSPRSSSMNIDVGYDRPVRQEPAGAPRPFPSGTSLSRSGVDYRRSSRLSQSVRGTRRSARSTVESTDLVYEKNQHPCTVDGCTKSYKRKEHQKRHMKAHEPPTYYRCHPECTRKVETKDRFDNFCSHFKKHTMRGNPSFIEGAAQWWEERYAHMINNRKSKTRQRLA